MAAGQGAGNCNVGGNVKNPSSKASQSSQPGKGTSKSGSTTGRSGSGAAGKQLSGMQGRLPSDSYAFQFPGALPVKQLVYAKDTFSDVWRPASIVHCRQRFEPSTLMKNTNEPLEDPSQYDYYVHWEAMDRRLDCWVAWEGIRALNDSLPDGEHLIDLGDARSDDDHQGMDEQYLREHEENTKLKTINKIQMGKYLVDTWYFSPYPKEYQNLDVLYICEWCLQFFKYESELIRHQRSCAPHYPPGNEIYRDLDYQVAMWEIDGTMSRIYCENLCFLSKLFLDHKTLRHPVNLFLFYTLTEISDQGYHFVGYFSKEKYSKNNVSCILTLPQYQRKGYGKFLISFSYVLSRIEGKRGTPERPLSDLGKASYMAFWTTQLLPIMRERPEVSVEELSDLTSIEPADVIACLEAVGVLRCNTTNAFHLLYLPESRFEELMREAGRPSRSIKVDSLHWQPYDQFMAPYEYSPNG